MRQDVSVRIDIQGITDEEYDLLQKFFEAYKPIDGKMFKFDQSAIATLLEFRQAVLVQYSFDVESAMIGKHKIEILVVS